MHIIVPLPYPRRNANNCYGPIESNSSPPSRGHSTSALNKLQQFSPSPSPTPSLPQFVSNERGSSFCPAAHVQCHPSRTRHPTPLLTHNGQKSSLGSPPRLSIQFRSILATIRNWLPDLCPTYRTRIAKNPSLSNRNIRSVDFSSGSGAEDARTEVCARSMPPILLYSMNRKLGPRICIYIYIFFLSFFFHPPSSSPLPSPHVNLKRVRGKRDNEPRCLIRAKLGGIWNMREGRKWLDSPPIQRIDGWKGIDGGDRWFFLFLFSFLPPDI